MTERGKPAIKDALRPPGRETDGSALAGKGGRRTRGSILGSKKDKSQWDLILKRKRATSEFIENVLQNIIESIVVTDLGGRLVLFNKYSEEMFGYRAEEVLDRHIVILGAVRPDVLSHIKRNNPYYGEVSLKRKDGTRFPAQVRCVPLGDELGRPVAMVGVAVDLTRDKEKERIAQEVARLKTFNENIIASINDGIQIIDQDGIITFINQRMEELLEYPSGSLMGSHYSEIVAPEDRFRLAEIVEEEGGGDSRTTFQVSWVTASNRKLQTLVSTSALRDGLNSLGVIVAVTDTSELQDLKEELFQSEKMSLVGTLASEVAHEINNPLGGLTVAVQMLIRELESGELDRQGLLDELRDIEEDARRCRTITRQLLDFSRPITRERVYLNLNNVIEDALVLVQRQAELDNIAFAKSYTQDLPAVAGDPSSLQQVIINLIKNAHDAMPEGGRIDLATERLQRESGAWVRITVGDTGSGISEEIRENIFNPFLTTKAVGLGTGLGLAVSKRIVEEFGGRIGFANKEEGGAEFEILLPAGQAHRRALDY